MMEAPLISGVAFTSDEAKLTIRGVKDQPGIASRILSPISEANIEVDMIVQNIGADQSTDFTFTVAKADYPQAEQILKGVLPRSRQEKFSATLTSPSSPSSASGCGHTPELRAECSTSLLKRVSTYK